MSYRPYVRKITNDRQIMFDCDKVLSNPHIYVIGDIGKLRVTSSRSVLPKEPPVLTGSGVPRGSLSASQGERTIQDFKVIM